MVRAGFVLLMLLTLTVRAAAEVRSVHVIEPRSFGYFLGDTLTRTVEIDTGPDDKIVPASLPRTGPSNYWLEVRSVETSSARRGDGLRHTLEITYQSFYAAVDPRKVVIPETEISLRGPGGNETVTIPSFTTIMSPIREIFPEKSGETSETFLRPDAPPALRHSGGLRTTALATLALSLLFLLLLARDLAWWPFHHRAARPFSRAVRDISRALAKGGAESYRLALLALHRAFDAAAGHRLMAADLDTFLAAHPEHGESRPLLERFFSASRSVFFGDAPSEGKSHLPPADLQALATALARQERAAR